MQQFKVLLGTNVGEWYKFVAVGSSSLEPCWGQMREKGFPVWQWEARIECHAFHEPTAIPHAIGQGPTTRRIVAPLQKPTENAGALNLSSASARASKTSNPVVMQ